MNGTGIEPVSLQSAHSAIFHPRILTIRTKKSELFSRTIHLETQTQTNITDNHLTIISRCGVV